MMVSVIIPNYNHAPFLKQRIDSVLNQTFQDFELIMLDDCSTDNSKEIIEYYRENEKVSHIVYNDANSGSTFKQWEKGIELAKGEYIWIAESDDWCEPTLLETLLKGVTPGCSIAFAQTLIVDNQGKILSRSSAEYLAENINGIQFVNNRMLKQNVICNASMCIFRKKNSLNIDNKFTEYKFCGDWLFYIELSLQGSVYVSGKTLNYFRKHNQDVSSKSFKSGLLYNEYIKLLTDLKDKKIINTKIERQLIIYWYRIFLMDEKVDKVYKSNIQKAFYKKMGVSIFYHQLKSLVRKVIR